MPRDEGAEPVVIFSGNVMDCDFLKSLLEGEQIPAYLKDEFMGGLEPFWAANAGETGGVKVVVAARDAERAAAFVQDFIDNRA